MSLNVTSGRSPSSRYAASAVMLLYNSSKYVYQSLESLLYQESEPLDIVISDDASRDSTVGIVKEQLRQYKGPHSVRLHLNQKNIGLGRHASQAVQMCDSDLVIFSAGDDISLPYRASTLIEAWRKSPSRIYALYSAATLVDENNCEVGCLNSPLPDYAKSLPRMISAGMPGMLGATCAIQRSLVSRFGPLADDVHYEDRAFQLRAHLLGDITYIDTPLLRYRRHAAAASAPVDRKISAEYQKKRRIEVLRDQIAMIRQWERDLSTVGKISCCQAAINRQIAHKVYFLAIEEGGASQVLRRFISVLSRRPRPGVFVALAKRVFTIGSLRRLTAQDP